ncbi:hypothetical protein ACFLVS_06665 [Chloroflexota bacterium]
MVCVSSIKGTSSCESTRLYCGVRRRFTIDETETKLKLHAHHIKSNQDREMLEAARYICTNKNWRVDKIEDLIWKEIERVLDNPDFIVTAIEKQRDDANNIDTLEPELQMVEKQLMALAREQKQLLQWALKGFPEDTVVAENKRINESRSSLQSKKAELETQIQASCEAAVSLPKLEEYIQLVREKLTDLDFDMKRLALDMLNIKVWVDGPNVEITGTIPVEDSEVVTTSS